MHRPPAALEPRSFVEQTVDALEQGAHVVEKGIQTAATLHTLYTIGRGIYTGSRALAPLLAVL
jgi:hypothetical protein